MDYRYMPFYMPGSMISGAYYQPESDIEEKDMEYLKEMYPKTMKRIQDIVEDECERQEFDGSIIYDQYPDKIGIGRMTSRIYDRLSMNWDQEENLTDKMWIKDVIGILLLSEMYRRRAKRRNVRRHYYMR